MTEEQTAGAQPDGAGSAAPNTGQPSTTPESQSATTPQQQEQADEPAFSWNDYVAGVSAKDEKLAKHLGKFSSVDDLAKSYAEAQKRISEGFKAPVLPKDATDEQVKEYRAKVGIPDDVKGYKLPETVQVKDADKPLWDLFLTNAHSMNLTQAELEKVAPAYYAMEKALAEQQEIQSKELQRANEQALREMWGTDAGSNMNVNEQYIESRGGSELRELLANSTDANGAPLLTNPVFAKLLQEDARLAGFANGVMSQGSMTVESVQEQIDSILTKRTGANREAYYKDKATVAKDEERLMQLYEAQARLTR